MTVGRFFISGLTTYPPSYANQRLIGTKRFALSWVGFPSLQVECGLTVPIVSVESIEVASKEGGKPKAQNWQRC
jgi:hypothetical protein